MLMRILYCRTGWMDEYKGNSDGDVPINGGKWNDEHIGHEIFNFLPYRKTYYGYVKPGKEKKGEDPKVGRIHIERLGADKNAESIDDVLVVWVAKKPKAKGQYVVGWYKDATVYKELHQVSNTAENVRKRRSEGIPKNDPHNDYNISTTNAVLVPSDYREQPVVNMGRSNIWYGDKETDAKVLKYIKNYRPGELQYKPEVTEWIFPCNPQRFRVDDAFREIGNVEWITNRKVKKGDICYIYSSHEEKTIRYKCVAVSDFRERTTINDKPYGGRRIGEKCHCIEIEPIGYYGGNGISLSDMYEHGLSGSLQAPIRVVKELREYIQTYKVHNFRKKLETDIHKEIKEVYDFERPLLGKEKEAVVKIRGNQGEFRKRILNKFGGECCMCGIKLKDMLIASHIIPWSESNEEDKVSRYNGLLLCANHDKLFDEGYISFRDDGRIMISKQLSSKDINTLGLKGIKIEVDEENKPFLEYHRDIIFKDKK